MADIEERTLSPTDPAQFERGRKIAEALVLLHHGMDLGLKSEWDVNYFIEKAVDLDRRKGRCRRRLKVRRKLHRPGTFVQRQCSVDRRSSP